MSLIVCSKCGQSKYSFEYYRSPKSKSGIDVACKACRNARAAERDRRIALERKLERILIVPDCHVPHHDEKAVSLMLEAANILKPEVIILLGDIADFYAVSFHDKDPKRLKTLDFEISAVNEFLGRLEALKAKKVIYIEGNHENRLARHIQRSSPALAGLISLPELFEIKRRGWEYIEYKNYRKHGLITYTHDLGKSGKYATHQALADAQASIVIGHLHRLDYVVEGDATGIQKLAFCPGWLGSAESADYKHRLAANRDWTLGFAVGHMNRKTGVTYITPIPIIRHEGVYSCSILGVEIQK